MCFNHRFTTTCQTKLVWWYLSSSSFIQLLSENLKFLNILNDYKEVKARCYRWILH